VELAEAASKKREDLIAAGWTDQPMPTWGELMRVRRTNFHRPDRSADGEV
jgi:hypothetical protein